MPVGLLQACLCNNTCSHACANVVGCRCKQFLVCIAVLCGVERAVVGALRCVCANAVVDGNSSSTAATGGGSKKTQPKAKASGRKRKREPEPAVEDGEVTDDDDGDNASAGDASSAPPSPGAP